MTTRIDTWTLQKSLDRLVTANTTTVQLPTEVIYREFGDGAISMLDKLYDDPYSEIIWPNKLRRFKQATEGNFVGVGILIRHNEKREIEVINPLEGTPAYFAGVKPNDVIVEVDGEGTLGWSLNDAVDRITGPKGKEVVVGVRREGVEDVVGIPIIRDVIKLRTVKGWYKASLDGEGDPIWDWFVDADSKIAYVRLTQFTDDTFAEPAPGLDGDHRRGPAQRAHPRPAVQPRRAAHFGRADQQPARPRGHHRHR